MTLHERMRFWFDCSLCSKPFHHGPCADAPQERPIMSNQDDIFAELDYAIGCNRNGSRNLVEESITQAKKLIRAELDALNLDVLEAENK